MSADPVSSLLRLRKHVARARRKAVQQGRGVEVALAEADVLRALNEDERVSSSDPMQNLIRGGVATLARWVLGLPVSPLIVEAFRGFAARDQERASLLSVLRARGASLEGT